MDLRGIAAGEKGKHINSFKFEKTHINNMINQGIKPIWWQYNITAKMYVVKSKLTK